MKPSSANLQFCGVIDAQALQARTFLKRFILTNKKVGCAVLPPVQCRVQILQRRWDVTFGLLADQLSSLVIKAYHGKTDKRQKVPAQVRLRFLSDITQIPMMSCPTWTDEQRALGTKSYAM